MALPTPKERFQANDVARGQFGEFVGGSLFAQAADVAMLEMQQAMPISTSFNQAAETQLRMEGARLYRRQLETLAEKPVKPAVNKIGRLNE
jgi:hypothetical protein